LLEKSGTPNHPAATMSTTTRDLSKHSDARTKIRVISPEKRDMLKKESELMFAKNLLVREKSKEQMFEKRLQHLRLNEHIRTERLSRWKEKTKHSPFAVNLVAEDERITEENRIRHMDEEERRSSIQQRKEKAKNEIILKALSEFSDLEALRREKRAIMDEEQRLKALLSLEKVSREREEEVASSGRGFVLLCVVVWNV
jgi:hypothetical protein